MIVGKVTSEAQTSQHGQTSRKLEIVNLSRKLEFYGTFQFLVLLVDIILYWKYSR